MVVRLYGIGSAPVSVCAVFCNGKQGSGGVLQSFDNQVLTIER